MCCVRKAGRTKWTESEKEILCALHEELGEGCWDVVSARIRGRDGKDARQVWRYHLDPKIEKKAFTLEEQKKIKQLREENNMGWSEMGQHFPGRDQIRLKNEYSKLKRHEQSQAFAVMNASLRSLSSYSSHLAFQPEVAKSQFQPQSQIFKDEDTKLDFSDLPSLPQMSTCEIFADDFGFMTECDEFYFNLF
jgi:hypothetical protein